MLEIRAKEDATIAVEKGSFPLGGRDKIKIYIEDEIIKQYIKTLNTNVSTVEANLYQYGTFSNESDIKNISYNLKLGASVKIAPGFNDNYSRCLYCHAENTGLGTCILKPSKQVEISTLDIPYKFSCRVAATEGTTAYLKCKGADILSIPADGEWHQIYTTFTAKENFEVSVEMLSQGDIYIDDLDLFKSEDEVIDNYFDNIEFEVSILNSCSSSNVKINDIITYGNDFVILDVPPIINVDYQDNILCQLIVNLYQMPRLQILGDTEYNKVKECVYQSDPFILTGYILPPDSDNVELIVGKV